MTKMPLDMKHIIGLIAEGKTLSITQARRAFDMMMSGEASPAQIGAVLMGLRMRGETVNELTGGVITLREKMRRITAPESAIDVVGTGGDRSGTYNISTAAGLVVAGCGVPVAKHGNRAASSQSGAADVLSSLGVNIQCDLSLVEKSLQEAGMCFMFAQRHHEAMHYVGTTRVDMGTRTIFNILGPLSNPADVKSQLVGVFSKDWLEPIAHVFRNLGSKHVWVVHGTDGLDEMTTTGPTIVAELKDDTVTTFEVSPGDAGLKVATANALKGGNAEKNAQALLAVLNGEKGAYRDIVLFNAAGALITAGKVSNLKDGVAMASEAIESGKAREILSNLVAITSEPGIGNV